MCRSLKKNESVNFNAASFDSQKAFRSSSKSNKQDGKLESSTGPPLNEISRNYNSNSGRQSIKVIRNSNGLEHAAQFKSAHFENKSYDNFDCSKNKDFDLNGTLTQIQQKYPAIGESESENSNSPVKMRNIAFQNKNLASNRQVTI